MCGKTKSSPTFFDVNLPEIFDISQKGFDMCKSTLYVALRQRDLCKGVTLMKRFIKELILFIIQLFMFYIFPLFTGPTDAMGMVFLIIIATFSLSLITGLFSKEKIKFLYPLAASVLFIPSVFIYYNESALVHALWYLIISAAGLSLGALLRAMLSKK